MSITGVDVGGDHPMVEVISLEPRVSLYHNFLSKEECEYLIEHAKPHLQKSRVASSLGSIISGSRTSSSASVTCRQDNIVTNIEKRIAEWTSLPAENGEGLCVIHYQVGQKFDPHFDYSKDKFNRIASVVMYLSDVEEGGETVFPKAKGRHDALPCWDKLAIYGKEGLSVKPKMGNALLFWNVKPDGITYDPLTLHGACPVIKGDKWCCIQLIRSNKYTAI